MFKSEQMIIRGGFNLKTFFKATILSFSVIEERYLLSAPPQTTQDLIISNLQDDLFASSRPVLLMAGLDIEFFFIAPLHKI